MPQSLDRAALLTGAVWCLVIAVPAAVVSSILADNDAGTDQSNWVFIALLVIVVAYLVGGAVAGERAMASPFVNGAAATVTAFAVVQVVGALIRVAQGDGINPVALVFNALLAATIGTVGAGIGARRASRRVH